MKYGVDTNHLTGFFYIKEYPYQYKFKRLSRKIIAINKIRAFPQNLHGESIDRPSF